MKSAKLKVLDFVLFCTVLFPGEWGMRECRNGKCVILCTDLRCTNFNGEYEFLAEGGSWEEVYCQLAVTKKLDLAIAAGLLLRRGQECVRL